MPFINDEILLGGFYTPSVSVVDSLQTGTLMRDEAVDAGALQVFANTEVLDIEVDDGRDRGRRHRQGPHRGRARRRSPAGCGARASPRWPAPTSRSRPAVHQMADVGPDRHPAGVATPSSPTRSSATWTRSATSVSRPGSMEVGSYAHRPIFHHPDDIPSNEESALSPTELPLTYDDFDPQMEQAIELMDMLGDAEIKYAINGLLSLTPDAMPVLGETPEVRNLWSAAAVWIKEGPGIAQLVAEWMTYGYPRRVRPAPLRHRPLLPAREDRAPHLRPLRRALQQDLRHRAPARAVGQPARHAPQPVLRPRGGARRGVLRRPRLGAPAVVRVERRPDGRVTRAGARTAPHEWDARWWSPITNAEHLHMREHVGMVDLTAFNEFDFEGPGALDYLQYMCVNSVDVPVGRIGVHAAAHPARRVPQRPHDHASRRRALPGHHRRLRRWPRQLLVPRHLPDRRLGHLHRPDVGRCARSACGARRREATMAKIVTGQHEPYDVTQAGFPYGAVREVLIDGVPCTMFRISYVGENGWEIYTNMEHGLRVWDSIADAGQEFDILPVGIGVYAVTGRIEKGYRLMGAELESEYNPVEAGLARPKVKSADFIGKEAYLEARDAEPVAILCTLSMTDQTSAERASSASRPAATSRSSPSTASGSSTPTVASSRVTTAGAAPSLDTYLLLAYLPPEHAVEGTELRVMYMNELYPVTVARVGSQPLFDPDDVRMKS